MVYLEVAAFNAALADITFHLSFSRRTEAA
jgi:hypothetical protein